MKAKKLARATKTRPQIPRWEGWLALGRLALFFELRLPGMQPQESRMCSHHSLCVPKQKRREGGATLIQLKHLQKAPVEATLLPQLRAGDHSAGTWLYSATS